MAILHLDLIQVRLFMFYLGVGFNTWNMYSGLIKVSLDAYKLNILFY